MRTLWPKASAVLAAAALVVGATGCGGASSAPSTASKTPPGTSAALEAPAKASPPRPAADFVLPDSLGRQVRLSQYRGKAVLLTFIYDHCPDVCPLIVSNLHNALGLLGTRASRVQIIAVSVDPRGDTPATVKAFLGAHEMTGRMEYLIGSEQQLVPVWRRWNIQVHASPDSREVGHSAFVYGITGSGKVTALYPSNLKPAWIQHDVPILADS